MATQLTRAQKELKQPILAGQLYKADGTIRSVESYDDKGTTGITYQTTSVSGLSGGGIVVAKEKFWGFTNTEPLTMVWLKRIALVADSSFHLNN